MPGGVWPSIIRGGGGYWPSAWCHWPPPAQCPGDKQSSSVILKLLVKLSNRKLLSTFNEGKTENLFNLRHDYCCTQRKFKGHLNVANGFVPSVQRFIIHDCSLRMSGLICSLAASHSALQALLCAGLHLYSLNLSQLGQTFSSWTAASKI